MRSGGSWLPNGPDLRVLTVGDTGKGVWRGRGSLGLEVRDSQVLQEGWVTKKGEGASEVTRELGDWDPGSPGTGSETHGPAEGKEQFQLERGPRKFSLQSLDYYNHVSYLV